MKIAQITIGQRYVAKVSGSLTTVRVLAIREAWAASAGLVTPLLISALAPRAREPLPPLDDQPRTR